MRYPACAEAGAHHAWASSRACASWVHFGQAGHSADHLVAALEAVIGHQASRGKCLAVRIATVAQAGCRTGSPDACPRAPYRSCTWRAPRLSTREQAVRSYGDQSALLRLVSGRVYQLLGRCAHDLITQNLRRLRLVIKPPRWVRPTRPPRTSSISVPVPAPTSTLSPQGPSAWKLVLDRTDHPGTTKPATSSRVTDSSLHQHEGARAM